MRRSANQTQANLSTQSNMKTANQKPSPRISLLVAALLSGLVGLISTNSLRADQNLLTNGDFEAGNSGFLSDCLYKPGGFLNESQFDVTTDPFLVHNFPGTYSFGDHTTGAGEMLVVNGTTDSTLKIWSETVTVAAHTSYAFTGWVSSWRGMNFSNLRLTVNGSPVLDFWSPSDPAVWQPFTALWSSDAGTSAVLAIYDLSTDQSGNDFALDDLSFAVPEPSALAIVCCAMAIASLGRKYPCT